VVDEYLATTQESARASNIVATMTLSGMRILTC